MIAVNQLLTPMFCAIVHEERIVSSLTTKESGLAVGALSNFSLPLDMPTNLLVDVPSDVVLHGWFAAAAH